MAGCGSRIELRQIHRWVFSTVQNKAHSYIHEGMLWDINTSITCASALISAMCHFPASAKKCSSVILTREKIMGQWSQAGYSKQLICFFNKHIHSLFVSLPKMLLGLYNEWQQKTCALGWQWTGSPRRSATLAPNGHTVAARVYLSPGYKIKREQNTREHNSEDIIQTAQSIPTWTRDA